MKQITTIILFIALVFISSCNKDEPKFSSSEIQRALFEMKGTYHGEMRVSYYHGKQYRKVMRARRFQKIP